MTTEEFGATIDGLIEKEGMLDTVNLSGGEPTMHPRFLEFLDLARAPGDLARLDLDQRPAHRQRLRLLPRARPAQGLREPAARRAAQPRAARCCAAPAISTPSRCSALDNLERAGVRTTIVVDRGQGRQRRPDRRLHPAALRARLHPLADVPARGVHRLRRRAFRAAQSARTSSPSPTSSARAEEQTDGLLQKSGLPAAAVLAPGLLRPDLPAQDRRRASCRSRASSSSSGTSR